MKYNYALLQLWCICDFLQRLIHRAQKKGKKYYKTFVKIVFVNNIDLKQI